MPLAYSVSRSTGLRVRVERRRIDGGFDGEIPASPFGAEGGAPSGTDGVATSGSKGMAPHGGELGSGDRAVSSTVGIVGVGNCEFASLGSSGKFTRGVFLSLLLSPSVDEVELNCIILAAESASGCRSMLETRSEFHTLSVRAPSEKTVAKVSSNMT